MLSCPALTSCCAESVLFFAQMLLVDSAYLGRKHIVPVYKQEAGVFGKEFVKRKRFNRLCSSGQVIVKSTLGTLKSRFPYVYDEMRQKKLGNAAKIILTACTLHNFLILTGSGYLTVLPQDEEEDDNLDEEEAGAPVQGDDAHVILVWETIKEEV